MRFEYMKVSAKRNLTKDFMPLLILRTEAVRAHPENPVITYTRVTGSKNNQHNLIHF